MAKTPYGVSVTTNLVTFPMAWLPSSRISISRSLCGTVMSASPTAMLKSTTAGTMLLASESKGLLGM